MALDAFKRGFEKRGDASSGAGDGGKGFAGGRGKANLQGDYERDKGQGNASRNRETGSWSLTRGPQSYSVFDNGIVRADTSNPHIKY